jgi:hypothetical protein
MGYRHNWNTLTFQINTTLMSELVNIFVEECDSLWKMERAIPAMNFMIISKDEIKHFSRNGGNALGFSEEEGPLLCNQPLITSYTHPFTSIPHSLAYPSIHKI